VLLVGIAEVTPPVGFNLFVLQNMTGHDSNYIARCSIPLFFLLIVCIALITAFPQIATWLPDAVRGVEK
jgi:TRAP-type C4-dicarboxylate transport system permease large subunit